VNDREKLYANFKRTLDTIQKRWRQDIANIHGASRKQYLETKKITMTPRIKAEFDSHCHHECLDFQFRLELNGANSGVVTICPVKETDGSKKYFPVTLVSEYSRDDVLDLFFDHAVLGQLDERLKGLKVADAESCQKLRVNIEKMQSWLDRSYPDACDGQ
jgi:hypothetical protein